MLETQENFVIDNIFTDEEIKDLYEYINAQPEEIKIFHKSIGYIGYMCSIPNHLFKKVADLGKSITDLDIELTEVSFSRYEQTGDEAPKLYPHLDDFEEGARLTIDIQVKSNIDWALFVEGKKFQLQDNQALVFAGTHQVHWREKDKFKPNSFLDMIFCHFTIKGSENLEESERKTRENFWNRVY